MTPLEWQMPLNSNTSPTPCPSPSPDLPHGCKLVNKQTSEGGGLRQPPPPALPSDPAAPTAGGLTGGWGGRDRRRLKHGSPHQLGSSCAQLSPGTSPGRGRREPHSPWGGCARDASTSALKLRGSCKPRLNSPARSPSRFLMH